MEGGVGDPHGAVETGVPRTRGDHVDGDAAAGHRDLRRFGAGGVLAAAPLRAQEQPEPPGSASSEKHVIDRTMRAPFESE